MTFNYGLHPPHYTTSLQSLLILSVTLYPFNDLSLAPLILYALESWVTLIILSATMRSFFKEFTYTLHYEAYTSLICFISVSMMFPRFF